MLIKSLRSWEIPEGEATPENFFRDRRRLVAALAAGPLIVPAALSLVSGARAAAAGDDPSAGLYPAMRNLRYRLDRPLSAEKDVVSYNNFYEFGSHKEIAQAAQALKIRPWTVTIDGMIEKSGITLDIDSFLKKMPLEERLYRHRCVEAWSMAVPWTGFALADLVRFARPLSGAKYLMMQTF